MDLMKFYFAAWYFLRLELLSWKLGLRESLSIPMLIPLLFEPGVGAVRLLILNYGSCLLITAGLFLMKSVEWSATTLLLLLGFSLSLNVWIKYCRSVVIWGFYFLSWLMETASGIVSMRPPVGQVAMMLNGLSQSLSLWVSKIVWNFWINWDANYSWVRLSGLFTITEIIP